MKENQSLLLTITGAVFTIAAFLILGRLVFIQTGPQKDQLVEYGDRTSGIPEVISPVRGKIYDRWGHLLAGNETVYEIGVDLLQPAINKESLALAASMVLGMDMDEVEAALKSAELANLAYYPLEREASAEQAAKLETMKDEMANDPLNQGYSSDGELHSLRGMFIEPHLRRVYPEKTLAANVLGFINKEPKSVYGVEAYFDELLSGVPKQFWRSFDPNRVTEQPEAAEGSSLVLTIDREIQSMVEMYLDAAVVDNGAAAGTIVVMQPETGEILAMASNPRMDINQFWRLGDTFGSTQAFNMAINTYEPGSVFKVFTMASALDSGTVEPETTFIDTGVIQVGGVPIYNWDRGAWGPQTMLGCMQHSLNVCLAWVGKELGADTFYSYLQSFGFGQPTGVELDLEYSGRLKMPGDPDWYEADLATNSFGQGISVTPIQMLMAVSSVANDGNMVVPRIIHAVVDRGSQYNTSIQIAGSPISEKTARILSEMLAVSLEEEASTALVEGFRVAGKTGTAEIPSEFGYTSGQTNASFMGWGPVDDPKFLVYIWIEKPSSSIWGSVVAAPIFSDIVKRLVVLMDIPPDHVRNAMVMP
jgi:cell division protein FtsI/penicillin-binding protein 2